MYFPNRLEQSSNKEDVFRQILIARIELVEQQTQEQIDTLNELVAQYKAMSKPLVFWPHSTTNSWVKFKKHFERLFAYMEESGVKNPKKMTVFEFYNRMEYLEKKADDANKKR